MNKTLFKRIHLCLLLFLLFGCGQPIEVIKDNDFDALELADFVEDEFPFIATSLDLRKIGDRFPDDNYVPKALAIKLGNKAYVGFDTDLLRWSVAWTGEFVSMTGVAQISYKDFFSKKNSFPRVLGKPEFVTGIYPGWTNYRPDFNDPRNLSHEKDSLKLGAVPESLGRWNGVYVHGNESVLQYTIAGTKIVEMPSSISFQGELAFTRTLRTSSPSDSLFMVAAEFKDIVKSEVDDQVIYLYHEGKEDMITAIGVSGEEKSDELYIQDNRYIVFAIPPSTESKERTLVCWTGPIERKAAFKEQLHRTNKIIPDMEKGGAPYWKQKVYTQGKLAPDTSAFVLDQLMLPLPNPWKRNVRVADIAFFDDGRAAIVTFEGDVWIIENIDKKLKKVKWGRFASGLYEPMSIVVKDEQIYVFGKEGIIRLWDLNKDGMADYYENFSPHVLQSMDSREWAADMAVGDDGYFYIAKGGGAIPPGSTTISVKRKGFRAASSQAGSILKISPDGEKLEVYATGLRAPYIGLHPQNGTLSVSDQQGNYVPATPIYLVNKGDYLGVLSAAHRENPLTIKRPLTWIPHNVDRSSISQVWITSDKMGPLNHSMVHFSFGRPGLFTVLIDSTSNVKQGGVSYILANYPAPVLKGDMNPKDGLLYLAGFNLWGSNSKGISALTRLRYTGKPSYLPTGVQIGKQGVILTFSETLKKEDVENPKNFRAKRWNYVRTEKYGSGHYLLNGEPGEETLPIISSHLGKNGKSVLIVLPNMEEVMQMQINYKLSAEDGTVLNDQFNFTVNEAKEINLKATSFDHVDLNLDELKLNADQLAALTKGDDEISLEKGAELFKNLACIGCHSTGTRTDGMYGPPFQKLYKSIRTFEDGSEGIADESYLKESILYPNKKIVKGYGDEMPSFTGILTENDTESLILFIKSL